MASKHHFWGETKHTKREKYLISRSKTIAPLKSVTDKVYDVGVFDELDGYSCFFLVC